MIGPTLGATILVLALITAGGVLGFAIATTAFCHALPSIEERAYERGFKRGKLIGMRDAWIAQPRRPRAEKEKAS